MISWILSTALVISSAIFSSKIPSLISFTRSLRCPHSGAIYLPLRRLASIATWGCEIPAGQRVDQKLAPVVRLGKNRDLSVQDIIQVDDLLRLVDLPQRPTEHLREPFLLLCRMADKEEVEALALVHLDEHTGLVVRVGGERLGLLGGNGGVALDEGSHHATGGFDTERKGSDIEKQQVLDGLGLVTIEDGSLHGGTVSDGLIGVDGLVQLLAIEEVVQQLLDLGNTGGATDEHDLVDLVLVQFGIAQRLLHRVQGGSEQVSAQFLKSGTGDGRVEVDALEERVDLDRGLGR